MDQPTFVDARAGSKRLRMSCDRSIVAVAGLSGLLAAPAGAAELKWTAPAGCPEQDVVERRVVDALGMPFPEAAKLSCHATVEQREPTRWQLTLELTNPADPSTGQRRTLEATTCDKLADAAALALSLALGDAAKAREGLPEEPTSHAAPAAPEHDEKTDEATSAAPPQTKNPPKSSPAGYSPWLSAGLALLVDYGTLPSIAPGVEGHFILGYRALGLRATGLVLPEQRTSESGPGGAFSLWAGSLSLCGSANRARKFLLCGGAELGQLRGEGVNVTTKREGHALWLAPRADVDWSIGLAEGVALLVRGGPRTSNRASSCRGVPPWSARSTRS